MKRFLRTAMFCFNTLDIYKNITYISDIDSIGVNLTWVI